MIQKVDNRIAFIDGDTVDVVEISFESGKRIKLVFDEDEEHYFYDEKDESKL